MELLDKIVTLIEAMSDYEFSEPCDINLRDELMSKWCTWMRKQLNDAELDFTESWYARDCEYISRFFVMEKSRSDLGCRINMYFRRDDDKVDITIFQRLDSDPYTELVDFPLNPDDMSDEQMETLNDFVDSIASNITD